MLTFRTLFSGGELFGVGAQTAGWQHVDGWEIEPKIAAVAQRNGFDVRVADVCQVDYAALPAVDHLHASPSCKNASQANVDAGEAAEDLACADAVCRAIAAHQGNTFTLENVWAYRNFESFGRILAALRRAGFVYDYDHINAADFGVPQTRKRLILRAVRGRERVPSLHPTHRKGGDMFHPPWVGWYEAIADLLPTLPATQPAPWQLARMPDELKEHLMPSAVNADGTTDPRRASEPAFTVQATAAKQMPRAYIVEGQTGSDGEYMNVCSADEPLWTVSASMDKRPARAYIVSNAATEYGDGLRAGDEPMFSTTAQHGGRLRALLVNNHFGDAEGSTLNTRDPGEPAQSITVLNPLRAHVAGRWVRMTVQALGRFQTVPDTYQGLTAEVNGNGVPCLLAQRIMESLR